MLPSLCQNRVTSNFLEQAGSKLPTTPRSYYPFLPSGLQVPLNNKSEQSTAQLQATTSQMHSTTSIDDAPGIYASKNRYSTDNNQRLTICMQGPTFNPGWLHGFIRNHHHD